MLVSGLVLVLDHHVVDLVERQMRRNRSRGKHGRRKQVPVVVKGDAVDVMDVDVVVLGGSVSVGGRLRYQVVVAGKDLQNMREVGNGAASVDRSRFGVCVVERTDGRRELVQSRAVDGKGSDEALIGLAGSDDGSRNRTEGRRRRRRRGVGAARGAIEGVEASALVRDGRKGTVMVRHKMGRVRR